jgi:hypothetical protein
VAVDAALPVYGALDDATIRNDHHGGIAQLDRVKAAILPGPFRESTQGESATVVSVDVGLSYLMCVYVFGIWCRFPMKGNVLGPGYRQQNSELSKS